MPDSGMLLLNNIVDLLDCFSLEQPELGVREAGRMLKLSPSTTGRLMAALRDAGVLRQNPKTRGYMLGGKVLAWAEVYSETFDIRTLVLPAMEELYRTTQETISLYVLEGNDRVCIERMESPHTVRIVARIGRKLPLYAGSAGKLMLAYLPAERQKEIIQTTVFRPFTDQTITDPAVLWKQIGQIRKQGYATSSGEWITEAAGVAAPILDRHKELQAALTISGPAQRFNPETFLRYAKILVAKAVEVSHSLGYPGEDFCFSEGEVP
ncbi:MAG TPA: IclR family transcriptional regulator [Anaerolineaceae bacterium]